MDGVQNVQNSSYYERQIAQKLYFYFDNYSVKLNLSIQAVFQNFITKQDLAYEIIKNKFKETNNSNIFILLKSLDASKLSKENMKELISLYKERNEIMPKISI